MFQRLLIRLPVVLAFALPATAEEKPGKEKEKSGKSVLHSISTSATRRTVWV
jgi:hypothetical protein